MDGRTSAFLLLAIAAAAAAGYTPKQFITGGDNRPTTIPLLQAMNASHTRLYCLWGYLQKELPSVNRSMTVSALRNNPELVTAYSKTLDWSSMDKTLAAASTAGISIILNVGNGNSNDALPQFKPAGKVADPNIIGRDAYLAYQYRFTRAVVERYDSQVSMWQTENELNEAFLSELFGQRLYNATKDDAWHDWTFLTQLLSTLRMAVKDVNSKAVTTMNFHTDIPKSVHTFLNVSGYYEDAVTSWHSLMDIVSFDAYPNYYFTTPERASVVGSRVTVIKSLCPAGTSVMVMEAGCAVQASNTTGYWPPIVNYNTTYQASWLKTAIDGAVAAGADGFIVFGIWQQRGMLLPPGNYSKEDIAGLQEARKVLLNETTVLQALGWFSSRQSYFEKRKDALMAPFEEGWGIVDSDGTRRPAYHAVDDAFKAARDTWQARKREEKRRDSAELPSA